VRSREAGALHSLLGWALVSLLAQPAGFATPGAGPLALPELPLEFPHHFTSAGWCDALWAGLTGDCDPFCSARQALLAWLGSPRLACAP
jgi:hypothetical protein